MEQKKNKTFFWVIATLIIVFAAIFAIQNYADTEINFLFFEVKGPLFWVILIIFFLGFFLGRIFHLLRKKKKLEKEKTT